LLTAFVKATMIQMTTCDTSDPISGTKGCLDVETGRNVGESEEQKTVYCEFDEMSGVLEKKKDCVKNEIVETSSVRDESKEDDMESGDFSLRTIEIDHQSTRGSVPLRRRRNIQESSLELSSYGCEDEHFLGACQVTIMLCRAAYNYGTPTGKLEQFATKIMDAYGYTNCYFGALRTEMFCGFRQSPEARQIVQLVELREGLNLHKLGYMASLMEGVFGRSMDINEVKDMLEDVDNLEDPYGLTSIFLCNVAVGASLAILLGGGWFDSAFGFLTSIPSFWISYFFGKRGLTSAAIAITTSFVSSTVASAFHFTKVIHLNVVLVTLSSVAIQIPGFGISIALRELLSDHILAGLSRLVTNFVLLLWLVAGAWLGIIVVRAATGVGDDTEFNTSEAPVSFIWHLLFAPMAMVAVCIALQISRRDTIPAMFNQALAYGTVCLTRATLQNDYIGTFLASVAMTLSAHLWSCWTRRSASILLFPSILLMVSGSTGFRGMTTLLAGDQEAGTQEVLQMFLAGVIIFAGVGAGQLLLPSPVIVL
jgi:uncharacterized membrane protein YjjP (DUF1212 family)